MKKEEIQNKQRDVYQELIHRGSFKEIDFGSFQLMYFKSNTNLLLTDIGLRLLKEDFEYFIIEDFFENLKELNNFIENLTGPAHIHHKGTQETLTFFSEEDAVAYRLLN